MSWTLRLPSFGHRALESSQFFSLDALNLCLHSSESSDKTRRVYTHIIHHSGLLCPSSGLLEGAVACHVLAGWLSRYI